MNLGSNDLIQDLLNIKMWKWLGPEQKNEEVFWYEKFSHIEKGMEGLNKKIQPNKKISQIKHNLQQIRASHYAEDCFRPKFIFFRT